FDDDVRRVHGSRALAADRLEGAVAHGDVRRPAGDVYTVAVDVLDRDMFERDVLTPRHRKAGLAFEGRDVGRVRVRSAYVEIADGQRVGAVDDDMSAQSRPARPIPAGGWLDRAAVGRREDLRAAAVDDDVREVEQLHDALDVI